MLSDGTQKNHARAAEGILTPSRPRRGAERHTAPPPSQVRPPARPAVAGRVGRVGRVCGGRGTARQVPAPRGAPASCTVAYRVRSEGRTRVRTGEVRAVRRRRGATGLVRRAAQRFRRSFGPGVAPPRLRLSALRLALLSPLLLRHGASDPRSGGYRIVTPGVHILGARA